MSDAPSDEKVELLDPYNLQAERMNNGNRKLIRVLNLRIDKKNISVHVGFETDYSSWPRWLPGPNFNRIDVAGVVHDALFRWHAWDRERTRPVKFLRTPGVWFAVARFGKNNKAKVSLAWGVIGWLGLLLFSWIPWVGFNIKNRA